MEVNVYDQYALYLEGVKLAHKFCRVNKIECPPITRVAKADWPFQTCGYYRYEEGIVVCVEKTSRAAKDTQVRNWNWPGSTINRTPQGVIAHELGHHFDYITEGIRGKYSSGFSVELRKRTKEPAITGYAPNDAEWFAEIFRLYVTNSNLLCKLRPRTWRILRMTWKSVVLTPWKKVLGSTCPSRIVSSQNAKITESEKRRKKNEG